jgi:hypothetical protein
MNDNISMLVLYLFSLVASVNCRYNLERWLLTYKSTVHDSIKVPKDTEVLYVYMIPVYTHLYRAQKTSVT